MVEENQIGNPKPDFYVSWHLSGKNVYSHFSNAVPHRVLTSIKKCRNHKNCYQIFRTVSDLPCVYCLRDYSLVSCGYEI